MQIIISAEFVEIIPYPWSDLYKFLLEINKNVIKFSQSSLEKRIYEKGGEKSTKETTKQQKKEQKPN